MHLPLSTAVLKILFCTDVYIYILHACAYYGWDKINENWIIDTLMPNTDIFIKADQQITLPIWPTGAATSWLLVV